MLFDVDVAVVELLSVLSATDADGVPLLISEWFSVGNCNEQVPFVLLEVKHTIMTSLLRAISKLKFCTSDPTALRKLTRYIPESAELTLRSNRCVLFILPRLLLTSS
jgi:hypothetical protein